MGKIKVEFHTMLANSLGRRMYDSPGASMNGVEMCGSEEFHKLIYS